MNGASRQVALVALLCEANLVTTSSPKDAFHLVCSFLWFAISRWTVRATIIMRSSRLLHFPPLSFLFFSPQFLSLSACARTETGSLLFSSLWTPRILLPLMLFLYHIHHMRNTKA